MARVANRQYCTAHGRSSPSEARMSSMSFWDASAGIMIVTGSPDSLTRANTTSETTKIDTIDCSKRPIRYRCTTSGLEDLDRLGQNDQDHAPVLGGERVLTAGWRVEVVAGLKALPADLDLALEDQDLLTGGMIVGRESRGGGEAHDGGRATGRGIPAQHLDRHTLEL